MGTSIEVSKKPGTLSIADERQPLLPPLHSHSHQTSVEENGGQDRSRDGDLGRDPSQPSNASQATQKRAQARSNRWRLLASFYSFFVVGMNTAATGALIPYLEPHYSLNDAMVSLVFLAPLTGYLAAASLNSTIHTTLGQRGIAIIGPSCQLFHAIFLSTHPPFPVIVLSFSVLGFGTGLMDPAWCAWAGGLPNANTIQGFLHGSFSLGATCGPFLATTLVAKVKLPWYTYYYIMTGAVALEFLTLVWAFRHDNGLRYCSLNPRSSIDQGSRMKEAFKKHVTWICAAYFLAYVGTEAAISGWVVTFMMRVRSASPSVSGMCASGFWAGMAIGRIVLGFVTQRYGERLSITVYLSLAIALEVIFWLVNHISVSVVTITLLGFFLGPLFPAGVVMITSLLPRDLHVSAIASAAAVGQTGGATFPFAFGTIAQVWGVKVFQPIVFAMLLLVLLLWLLFPRLDKESEDTEASARNRNTGAIG